MSQIVCYASGMSSIADFSGFARAGHPVGVMALDVSSSVARKICEYTAAGGKVFVDSGAFPAFVRRTTVDFERVFGFYSQLALSCRNPGNLALVGPDVIGDMDRTATLQIRYLDRLQDLAAGGVEVIIPFQTGWPTDRYRSHFDTLAQTLPRFTIGFAYNKASWQAEDVALLVRTLNLDKVHLFGIGKRRIAKTAGILWGSNPRLFITSDSNRLRAMVGKGRKLSESVAESLEKERGKSRTDFLADYLKPEEQYLLEGRNEEEEREAEERFEDRWDDTENCYELYNSPGFLTSGEARAWAMELGITDKQELSRWARWSQEDVNHEFHEQMCQLRHFEAPFGCKLGYLLELNDGSGYCAMTRNHNRFASAIIQARTNEARPRLRAEHIARIAQTEQKDPLQVQLAMGF